MPRVWPIIRKITQVIGGVVNFPAPQTAGITQRSRYVNTQAGRGTAGVAVEFGPFTGLTRQGAGAEMVSTSIELTRSVYVDVSDESPSPAASDWENPENSEGAEDGSYSDLSEGILLVQGTLIGDFPDHTGKDGLDIDSVKLQCFYSFAQILLPGSTLTIRYRVGDIPSGTATNVRTIVGNALSAQSENHLTTPETFDITGLGPDGIGGAWTWADLNALQIEYVGTILVDVGLTQILVDATRLDIEASSTEAA